MPWQATISKQLAKVLAKSRKTVARIFNPFLRRDKRFKKPCYSDGVQFVAIEGRVAR